jgi:hypothetical protein
MAKAFVEVRSCKSVCVLRKTTTMAATKTSITSVRYQRLLECISKALEKCRHQIDIDQAIQMFYGEGDGNEVFCTMLDGILDQFHTEVIIDMRNFFQKEKIEEELLKLEAIIRKVDYDLASKEEASINDKESAIVALKNAKLPEKMSPQDLIRYQSYQHLMLEKKRIEEEINVAEREISRLASARDEYLEITDGHVQEMQSVKMELEQSADLCSMVK